MKRATLIAAIACLACYGGLLVEPSANVNPSLSVGVETFHDQIRRVRVSAELARGTGADGAQMALLDSTMVIDGVTVTPSRIDAFRITWSLDIDVPGTSLDTIEIHGPTFSQRAEPQVMLIPISARIDNRVVDLGEGQDLVLNMAAVPDSIRGFTTLADFPWHLSIENVRTGRPALQLTGRGAAPSSITIPSEWLSVQSGDSLVAGFLRFASHQATDGGYDISLFSVARFAWSVRVVDP